MGFQRLQCRKKLSSFDPCVLILDHHDVTDVTRTNATQTVRRDFGDR